MASFKLVSFRDFIPRTFALFSKNEGYSWSSFGKDCIAGLTVGVVAMPLAMAFSIAAGGTPAQGLYTAIIAGFLISFFGGSKFQIGGPTGAFVVIIFSVIAKHGMNGLMTAAVLAGVILIILGVTGLGKFIKFIPYPVTTGFTTGIGVLIFSQQVKDFFGMSPSASSPEFLSMWASYFRSFSTLNPAALGIGLGTMILIIVIRKRFPRIPAAAAAVLGASLVCYFFSIPAETIGMRFGEIPRSLPRPVLPSFSPALIRNVMGDSFAIALLAAIESLLSAVVADGMSGDRHNSNMELAAQGLGNIAAALFGGIPATGAIARTATNIKSGAVSPVAGMIHALVLVFFILFLAPMVSAVPLAALSAVLIVVSWDMSNLGRFVRIIKKAPKSDALVLITTFALTVLEDLTVAVEVGVILACFLFMRRMAEVTGIKPGEKNMGTAVLYGSSGNSGERPEYPKDIEVYEITGPFFFGIADALQNILLRIDRKPRAFVLRMQDVPAIDSTGIAALESFLGRCRKSKIELILCEIREQPRKALEKSGFTDDIGRDHIRGTLEDALRD